MRGEEGHAGPVRQTITSLRQLVTVYPGRKSARTHDCTIDLLATVVSGILCRNLMHFSRDGARDGDMGFLDSERTQPRAWARFLRATKMSLSNAAGRRMKAAADMRLSYGFWRSNRGRRCLEAARVGISGQNSRVMNSD